MGRANNSAFETMSEIVAIWNGVAMMLSFDMSTDGKSSPTVQAPLLAGAIQTAVELLLTDYLSIVAIYILLDINLIDRMSGRHWYWSLPTVPFMIYASSALF